MWRRNVVELPDDVLVIILSFLHNDDLRTARTMCKAFRQASIPCVTRLSFIARCWPEIPWRMINDCLHVFKNVKCLELPIRTAQQALLLEQTGVLPRLHKLYVACRSLDDIIPLVAQAPELRFLYVEVGPILRVESRRYHQQLFQAAENCRHREDVTVCEHIFVPCAWGVVFRKSFFSGYRY
jgi:hypothetical protein